MALKWYSPIFKSAQVFFSYPLVKDVRGQISCQMKTIVYLWPSTVVCKKIASRTPRWLVDRRANWISSIFPRHHTLVPGHKRKKKTNYLPQKWKERVVSLTSTLAVQNINNDPNICYSVVLAKKFFDCYSPRNVKLHLAWHRNLFYILVNVHSSNYHFSSQWVFPDTL